MSRKLLTLNVRGLNSSRKRRQVFRWLHLQRSDIIFLQETYSSTETIKRWEAEWGGKVVASHGTTHSKGVMVLFKPNLNATSNKTLADKNGRYILAETSIDETNIVFVNIYAPNLVWSRKRFQNKTVCFFVSFKYGMKFCLLN